MPGGAFRRACIAVGDDLMPQRLHKPYKAGITLALDAALFVPESRLAGVTRKCGLAAGMACPIVFR